MNRDIKKVIKYLLDEVIPSGEAVRVPLNKIIRKACYAPPEGQAGVWWELSLILGKYLGDPSGAEWKGRVNDIVEDREKIT